MNCIFCEYKKDEYIGENERTTISKYHKPILRNLSVSMRGHKQKLHLMLRNMSILNKYQKTQRLSYQFYCS